MSGWTIRDIPDLSGRLAVVTGATGGLGLEVADKLAAAGCEVILAARDPAKGRAALASIRARQAEAGVKFEVVDLSSLASVRDFADRLLLRGRPIDILVNNAGVMALPKRGITADRLETQFGVNYVSHFALTACLMPLLMSAGARVVQVSSISHRSGRISLEDLNAELNYRPWPVYSQSKLAMVMFALELNRRSQANGWGVTSVAAHPGIASTDLMANGPMSNSNLVVRWLGRRFVALIGQSVADGAHPILLAATKPDAKGGQYFGPQGWKELKGRPGLARIAPQALDPAVAARLWSASEQLANVSFAGRHKNDEEPSMQSPSSVLLDAATPGPLVLQRLATP